MNKGYHQLCDKPAVHPTPLLLVQTSLWAQKLDCNGFPKFNPPRSVFPAYRKQIAPSTTITPAINSDTCPLYCNKSGKNLSRFEDVAVQVLTVVLTKTQFFSDVTSYLVVNSYCQLIASICRAVSQALRNSVPVKTEALRRTRLALLCPGRKMIPICMQQPPQTLCNNINFPNVIDRQF